MSTMSKEETIANSEQSHPEIMMIEILMCGTHLQCLNKEAQVELYGGQNLQLLRDNNLLQSKDLSKIHREILNPLLREGVSNLEIKIESMISLGSQE